MLLDAENARLATPEPSQQETALALAKQQGRKLVNLAEDIVEHGLDPTVLPVIVGTSDRKKRYRVLEGNRRVLALKALETPGLVGPALNSQERTRLNKLSALFLKDPIDEIECILFSSSDEAIHWIRLRHTGENEGIGVSQWGAADKDRFEARHGERSSARQIIDFVEKHGALSQEAQASNTKIITNLKRLVNTPDVRSSLGIDMVGGKIYSEYPTKELAKGLSKVVEDLMTGEVKVPDIYTADQRKKYIESISKSDLPAKSKKLAVPQVLDDLTAGSAQPEELKSRRPPRRRPKGPRTTLIPRTCNLDIGQPRINAIYVELSEVNVESYPNAAAVLLRVFLELSVDHYLSQFNLTPPGQIGNTALAKKIKDTAAHLRKQGVIDSQLERAMKKVADGSRVLAAGTVTFNQYVHNYYVHPSPVDLRGAWDELQPFMEALWPPQP